MSILKYVVIFVAAVIIGAIIYSRRNKNERNG